jgi:hypothetical protein
VAMALKSRSARADRKILRGLIWRHIVFVFVKAGSILDRKGILS